MSREQQDVQCCSLTATYNMNYTCRIDALINASIKIINRAINAIKKNNRSTALNITVSCNNEM